MKTKYFIFLCVIFFPLSSCKHKLEKETPYPFTSLKRLAVCPILFQPTFDESGNMMSLDSERLGRILAEEWTKFSHEEGMMVTYPRETASMMNLKGITPNSPENIKKIGRLLNAQAVCIVQLNNYEPFSPKSCSLTFYLYATESNDFTNYKILNITQIGTDAETEEEDKAIELAHIQKRWDGRNETVRKRAEAWANRQNRIDESGWDYVLKIENDYFRFIFNATIRDYIERLNELRGGELEGWFLFLK